MSAAPHPYIGMWVTADGRIRYELLLGGRHHETRAGRAHTFQECYRVMGSRIDDTNDTGPTGEGGLVAADVLHHAGMVLRSETGANQRG